MRLFQLRCGREPDGPLETCRTTWRSRTSGQPGDPVRQAQVEGRNAEIRKNVLKYDDVLNRQREAILQRPSSHPRGGRHQRPCAVVPQGRDRRRHRHAHRRGLPGRLGPRRDVDRARDAVPISISIDEVITEAGSKGKATREFLAREILSDAKLAYQQREGSSVTRPCASSSAAVVLSVIERRGGTTCTRWTTSRTASAPRDGTARPAGRVPARGLRALPEHDGPDPRGVGRVPVQPRGPGAVGRRQRGHRGEGARGVRGHRLEYSAPSIDGEVEVRDERGRLEQAATARAQRAQAEAEAEPPVRSRGRRSATRRPPPDRPPRG